jgi:hypothetical protein
MTLENKISNYLQDLALYTHHNLNGVDIEYDDELNFSARICLLDYRNENDNTYFVFLDFYSKKANFLSRLNIHGVPDLDAVTGAMLMQLYQEGAAEIVCFVDIIFTECMSFRKNGPCITARNGVNQLHTVEEILETPSEYLRYSKDYYMQPGNFAVE